MKMLKTLLLLMFLCALCTSCLEPLVPAAAQLGPHNDPAHHQAMRIIIVKLWGYPCDSILDVTIRPYGNFQRHDVVTCATAAGQQRYTVESTGLGDGLTASSWLVEPSL